MPFSTQSTPFRSSFQYKLFRVFTLLTAGVSIFFCTLYIATEIKEKRAMVSELLRLQARNLGETIRLPLYAENSEQLLQHANEMVRIPEIRSVVITSSDGRVLAHAETSDSGAAADVFSLTVPILSSPLSQSPDNAFSESTEGSALIGNVHIERGAEDLNRMIRKLVMVSSGVAVGFWLSVSLFSYLALRKVTRSFNALISGIAAMQRGDLTSRIEVVSDDEPGRAAHAINALAKALQQSAEENFHLHEEHLNLERQMLQNQKLESLGIMAGGIAHDYNNLLQSILGNIELASLKLDPDSPSSKYIANAMSSGRHAAHLTNLMLTYVGKGYITKNELNLNELVRENAGILKTAASSTISMKMNLAPELPCIKADDAHIQQVVMNLIINATESIEKLPGVVTITTGVRNCDRNDFSGSLLTEKPEPGRFVFLEVSDNGCGMDKETLSRLFDPFFTTKFTGRGLGMSAVIGIVRMHDGALFVESEPGIGTTFTVLFPALDSMISNTAQEPVVPVPEQHAISEKPFSGIALVVDDEKPVLKICRKMVELCGFTVITACDGIEAVALFREHADEIAVVLMDLKMPNMDGITAMGEIYRIRPDARVILSSGFNEDELSERLTTHAPAGFIRKPYSMSALETELRRVVQA